MLACGTRDVSAPAPVTASSVDDETEVIEAVVEELAAAPSCETPLPVYAGGEITGEVCPSELDARGLTALDLSDAWTPFVFSEDASLGEAGEQPYREVFLALADERLEDVPEEHEAERFLELYGIFPTFRVLLGRLADEERHACHAAVDDEALAALDRTLKPWTPTREEQRSRVRTMRYLESRLERIVEDRGLEGIAALEGDEDEGHRVDWYRRLAARVHAIEAVQAHLACDELGDPRRIEEGVFDGRTSGPLADWQRMHMIVSAGFVDEETRRAMLEDSREQDYRAVLRALRERVVDATGILEDGSAGHAWGEVFGRELDAPQFRFDAGQDAVHGAAPDLVSPATEAAAEALGWLDAGSTLASLRSIREAGHAHVALALPAAPAYHARHIEALRAELDRGTVWYRYPYTPDGRYRGSATPMRPVLTLYAGDTALVRWPSTIGGWKPETTPTGGTGLRYKESPVGARVWRDVIASPAWLPPASAPPGELLRSVGGGRHVPRHDLFGPGYRSAYGLVMMMHHKVLPPLDPGADGEDGLERYYDQGIRVHGSVSYRSITRGTSHGCHRLYNHLAVRLASFVLRHRNHTRHGSMFVRYQREVSTSSGPVTFRINSRGYRYELTPPVPIEVLEGDVRGGVRQPIRGFLPLRSDLMEAAEADAAADG